MKSISTKLQACEVSLKRWHSRLARASNMVVKLEKQRRRLQAQMGPVGLTELIGPAKTKPAPVPPPEPPKPEPEDRLAIPPFLKREPVDVAKLAAQRKSKEAADKHKMPLTGRAAMAAIMAPPVRPKQTRKAKA